jgi:hypothetical protein
VKKMATRGASDATHHRNEGSIEGDRGNETYAAVRQRHRSGLTRNHLFLRKKKFWNAAIASGERILSPKK